MAQGRPAASALPDRNAGSQALPQAHGIRTYSLTESRRHVVSSFSAIDVCLKVMVKTHCCPWNHVLEPRGGGGGAD